MEQNIDGYELTAVGFAKNNKTNTSTLKKVARIQGMGELSKMIKIYIDNEISSYTSDHNGNVINDIKTYSRQRSDNLLKSIEEIDSWINPSTGDYYLLLGIKGK